MQTTPKVSFTDDEVAKLTDRIQNGGTEVVEAKAGAGSATLSMVSRPALLISGEGRQGELSCSVSWGRGMNGRRGEGGADFEMVPQHLIQLWD